MPDALEGHWKKRVDVFELQDLHDALGNRAHLPRDRRATLELDVRLTLTRDLRTVL